MRALILFAVVLSTLFTQAHAHRGGSDRDDAPRHGHETSQPDFVTTPLLVIGASYANGHTPFDGAAGAPLLGLAVAQGQYLSLGDALVRDPGFSGHVVNEAQASATTDSRPSCRTALYNGACSLGELDGYDTQLMKALARVYSLSTGAYNAEYVIITTPNDCLHSDAFGIPEADTQMCDDEDMYDVADNLIQVGQMALDLGLTPIYAPYPAVENLDLELSRQSSLLSWVITEADYQRLNDIVMDALAVHLPEALVIDYWSEFTHLGDGLHPDRATVENAARMILETINYRVEVATPGRGHGHRRGRGHRRGWERFFNH